MKPIEAGVRVALTVSVKSDAKTGSSGGHLEVAPHPGQSSHENTILPNLDVVKVIKVIVGSKS